MSGEEVNANPEESFAAFMSGIEEHVTKLVRDSIRAPATLYEHLCAFAAAIDWTESWIRGLLFFHIVSLLIVVVFRKNTDVQSIAFMLFCGLVFVSERLNSYCHANWRLFAKQDYFDKAGVFAGVVFSGPLLLICLLQLVC